MKLSEVCRSDQFRLLDAVEDGCAGIVSTDPETAERIRILAPFSLFMDDDGIKFVPENGVPQFHKAFVVPFADLEINLIDEYRHMYEKSIGGTKEEELPTCPDCGADLEDEDDPCDACERGEAEEEAAWNHEHAREYGNEDLGFADPGGRSALRAETPDNPRNLPCPTCGAPDRLTPADRRLGYQCDTCADAAEGVGGF